MKWIMVAALSLFLLGCEYPIAELNEWWRYDVLGHNADEEDTTIVHINTGDLEWPE